MAKEGVDNHVYSKKLPSYEGSFLGFAASRVRRLNRRTRYSAAGNIRVC